MTPRPHDIPLPPDLWALMPERTSHALQAWARLHADGRPPVTSGPARPVAVGQVAVIQILGFIDQRYWASTTAIGQLIDQLVLDPAIKAIVLEIDSPGGTLYGVPELAAKLLAAREQKKIVAIANSLMASAAYWIGTAAEEVWVTPGGEVGAIGVWQMHIDASEAMKQIGWAPTIISAGKYKMEGNPYEPLGDEAKVFMQQRIDEYYDLFTKGVAKARGVTPAAVRAGYGAGRVLGAVEAKAANLVDRIGTMDELLGKLGARPTTGARRALAERWQTLVERELEG